MRFRQSELWSVAPTAIWLVMSLGIVLAAEIAAALSLVFVATVFPLSYNGDGAPPLVLLGLIFFLVVVPFVGLLVGLPTWWRFVARPNQITRRRGVLLGMLSGMVAHPLVWICLLPPLGFGLLLIIPASVLSLIYVGWITAAVGGIAGGVLVHLHGALLRRMRQHDGTMSLPTG
jgi:hypothetical protein